jgi:spoIIIJ-associated protein
MEQDGNNIKEFTDEDLDTIADTAISIIQDILFYFNVGNITIDEYDGEDSELILDITGDDLAVLIGRHGKTLEALQTIVSAILLQKIGYRYPVIVDVEGYKSRQREKLESIAKSAASRAVKQNKNIHLNPMSPYERRIIHIALSSNKKVTTQSEGEGSKRHVVISPL